MLWSQSQNTSQLCTCSPRVSGDGLGKGAGQVKARTAPNNHVAQVRAACRGGSHQNTATCHGGPTEHTSNLRNGPEAAWRNAGGTRPSVSSSHGVASRAAQTVHHEMDRAQVSFIQHRLHFKTTFKQFEDYFKLRYVEA